MTDLDVVLDAEPGEAAWLEICRFAEGLGSVGVAEVAGRLRAWPDHFRPMPDWWWAQRQAGDHRPWHVLATHRRLCQLGEYFYVSVAACPNDLRLLLAGSGATSNSDLGRVLLLRPDPEIEAVDPDNDNDAEASLLVASLAERGEAVDGQFSPDGSQVAVGFSEDAHGPVVYGADGQWQHGFAADGDEDRDGDEDGDWDDDDLEYRPDIDFIRVGYSGDGRLIAGGRPTTEAVAVAEAATGKVLLSAAGATGPVALDHAGRLLAYACPDGRVAVRDVLTGELLSTADTKLDPVYALAFSPDGRGLVAAGGSRPAACLLTLDHGVLTSPSIIPVADPALTLDATLPFAGVAPRACWTDRGPQVFAADDHLAVLFDGSSGRVRWTSTVGQVTASFTPDGRTLVASGPAGVINAWFLDSLSVS